MGAAGDLKTKALSRAKVVRGGPDVDLEVQGAIFLGSYAIGCEADDAVAQVDRLAGGLYGTEASEEVGVLQVGADVEIGGDRADDNFVLIEFGTGIDQDVGASFQFAIIFC